MIRLPVWLAGRPLPVLPDPPPEVEDEPDWPLPADAAPVHVVGAHGEVRVEADRLSIAVEGGEPSRVRLDDVSALFVHGAVKVTTPAALALMRRSIPVLWHGFDGRLIGRTAGLGTPDTAVREAQYAAEHDPARRLALARAIVVAKVRSSRRLLRRRLGAASPECARLDRARLGAERAADLDTLRGWEGAAAQVFLAAWGGLIDAGRPHLAFRARSRRPPGDPANAALSYLYAILHGRCLAAAAAAGLDPAVGFLHARRPGRSSLALDLMEPFRPLLVEGPLAAAFNNGEFPPAAFEPLSEGSWSLTAAGRRTALGLFERTLGRQMRNASDQTATSTRDAIVREAAALARALRTGSAFAAFEPAR